MRTLTAAQLSELQSYGLFREIVEVGSIQQFTTYHSTSATDGHRNTGLQLNSFGMEVDPLNQGGASSFQISFDLNNADLTIDAIDYDSIAEASYWDNEQVVVKMEFQNNTWTVGKGAIKNWNITNEWWSFDCANDTEKYNIDLLEENNDRTETALPDESIGTFKPKVYSSASTDYKFPLIPIRTGVPKLLLCDHDVDDAGIASTDIYIYIPSGDVYGALNNVLGGSFTAGTPSFYEFFDARVQISNFRKWTPGPDHDVSITDLSNILDEDTGTYITVGASTTLAVLPELNLTGILEDPTTYVTYSLGFNTITGSPTVGLYDIINSTYPIGGHPITITGNHSFNGPAAMTLADLQNYEIRVDSGAGESVRCFEIGVTIVYRPFGRITKEYNRYYNYLRVRNRG